MRDKKTFQLISFLGLMLVTACRYQPRTQSVSEVIRNASSLNGKTVRVQGQAFLWVDPSREEMWMFGGCAINPDGSPSEGGHVSGWLALYDGIDPDDLRHYGAPHDDVGIKISKDDFDCQGNYCKMTCTSFEAVSQRTYEFVGVLRVKAGPEYILENIDFNRSRQLVDGKWSAISTGDFDVWFP